MDYYTIIFDQLDAYIMHKIQDHKKTSIKMLSHRLTSHMHNPTSCHIDESKLVKYFD